MRRSQPSLARAGGTLIVQAIGPGGWAIAERRLDHASAMTIEDVAEGLRAGVRTEVGSTPRIVVLDHRGRDVTRRYEVN